MPTNVPCAPTAQPSKPAWLLGTAMAAALLGGCTPASEKQVAEQRPIQATSLNQAVRSVTEALLADADVSPHDQRVMVIDPMIERASGYQYVATRSIEPQVMATAEQRFPRVHRSEFTRAALQQQPIVLVGCTTAVAAPGKGPADKPKGPAKTYRIWASLADMRTGRFITNEQVAYVHAKDMDMTPTKFFRDSPAWTTGGDMKPHLEACAGKRGEAVSPYYLNGIKAAVVTNDAIKLYEAGRYKEALETYQEASALPDGNQMRVLNGLYLTNLALNKQNAAEDAFGRMVDNGLAHDRLAVKFVFQPGTTKFWPNPVISGQYPMWLRQIAERSAERKACLLLTGHTSPTGPKALNEMLSEQRAEYVRNQLVRRAPVLKNRTEADGRGSSEPIIGNGEDNATDVLDRRVEFERQPCDAVHPAAAPGRT